MEGWGAMNMRRKLNVGCGLSWAGVPNHYIVAGALLVFKKIIIYNIYDTTL